MLCFKILIVFSCPGNPPSSVVTGLNPKATRPCHDEEDDDNGREAVPEGQVSDAVLSALCGSSSLSR